MEIALAAALGSASIQRFARQRRPVSRRIRVMRGKMVRAALRHSAIDVFTPENTRAIFVSPLMVFLGAIFDFVTPLGVAGGTIYLLFVVSAVWWRSPYTAFAFSALATALTLVGYSSINRAEAALWIVHFNRGISVFSFWVVALNICYQKKIAATLMQNRARLQAIQDGTADGIITIDDNGTVGTFNLSCERIFGYSPAEVIGRNLKFLLPEPYRSEHDGYLKRYRETGKRNIIGTVREALGQRKDGSVFPLDLSVSEVNVDGERLFIGMVRDITARKREESERQGFIEKIVRSNKELDEFAYVASHDLKAPLRVIDNVSRWLEEDLEAHLDDDSRENMQLLRSRVARMERLLDDLLEYSRIGRKEDERYSQKTPGHVLMDDVLLLVDKPENFTINVSPGFADTELNRMPISQIFVNLINNAIKHHNREDGTVNVAVADQGNEFCFTVQDDGPGIAPEFHDRIFKMFQTLKSRDQVEGSGMGLAVVAKHVEYYGGRITLDSAESAGSTFRFTWPKNQEPV